MPADFPREEFPLSWSQEKIDRIKAAHEAAAVLLAQGLLQGLVELTLPDPYQKPKELSKVGHKAVSVLREKDLLLGLECLLHEERLYAPRHLIDSGRAFGLWLTGFVEVQKGSHQIELMKDVVPPGLMGIGVGFNLVKPGEKPTAFALAAGGYGLVPKA
ncbi:hypothetical protein [Ktedonospora formicarum]|uniref:Uncharacterized protein n=1 Tax=Ktedonospora formicarum TaxID=2778364 RepID=A0A8J3I9D8_9CHLR|nr:hypothetical protein [Ktedonospora formicarum]GHO48183.1 hypothetical protein KSX_63460 [Ktedonospora formicarum]